MITDIKMPGLSGIALTKKVRSEFPNMKVLVLTMYNDSEIVAEIIGSGAHGYILKNTGKEELLKALEALAAGTTFFSQPVLDTMVNNLRNPEGNKNEHINSAALTSREKEIVKLIAHEQTNKQIAAALFISPRTVETHRKNIFRKTGVKSIAGLIRYAFEHKLA